MKRLLAAFIFFTRLPFGRIMAVPANCFKHVVPYWPIVGWLTGGILAGTLWLLAQVLPLQVAWIGAIVVRLLVTGCLHEDGLADFCDGFGGGTTRERTLAIMKDSHIGTYGVVGLIVYFLLWSQMIVFPLGILCAVAFCADVYSKWCVSHMVNLLPYARKEEESKAKVLYSRMTLPEVMAGTIAGWLPLLFLQPVGWGVACFCPPIVFLLLCGWMKRRIGGYTGDCCGAVFLLGELSFYIGSMIGVWK